MSRLDPSAPIPELAPAPRSLPGFLTIRVLFGTFMSQFGWLFVAFGMLFVWVFDAGGVVAEWVAFRGGVRTASGTVTGWNSTSTSINERPVYTTSYDFRHPDGRTFSGTSYATGRWLEAGTEVTVEFVDTDPALSRITGMRTSVGGGMVLLVLIFPAVGAAMALADLKRRRKALRLLRHGTLTAGQFDTMEATSTRINEQPVMRLTFRFQDEYGAEHTAVAKSHQTDRLQDEPRELIVYDPLNPANASVLDELPCQPRVGPDGNFESTVRTLPSALYLLLPGISVLTALRYVASLM
jgi:hypothetical protein